MKELICIDEDGFCKTDGHACVGPHNCSWRKFKESPPKEIEE